MLYLVLRIFNKKAIEMQTPEMVHPVTAVNTVQIPKSGQF